MEAHNAVRLAREILARTLGLQEQVPVDIKGESAPGILLPPGDVKSLWQEALEEQSGNQED